MVKGTVVMALLGVGVGLTLSIMWRVINLNDMALSYQSSAALSSLTLALCPPSFVMMEVGPREPIVGEIAALYAEVILANGALYGAVTMAVLGIAKVLRKIARK